MSLSEIDLSQNKLCDVELEILSQVIVENQTLRVIKLHDNHLITEDGVDYLLKALDSNTSIQAIELHPTSILQYKQQVFLQYESLQEKIDQKLNSNNRRLSIRNSIIKTQSQIYQNNFPSSIENQFQKSEIREERKQNRESSMFDSVFFNQESTLIRTENLTQIYSLNRSSKHNIDYIRMGLSIDGGGMRGLIPATMINYICRETKYEVHQIFDCVGGTSIGGILALGSTGTLDGVNPIADSQELIKIFQKQGTTIFNSSKIVGLWNNILRDQAKYDPAGIQSVLNQYFQNCKLSDVLPYTNVLVTGVKRQLKQGSSPAKIFRSRQAIFNPEKDFFMRDVARATSAAPTYFPSAEIKNINGKKSYDLIDGGVGQNNPSQLVIQDIKNEAGNSGNASGYFLVSMGTGVALTTKQLSQNAGVLNILPILENIAESSVGYIEKEIETNYQGHYVRAQPLLQFEKAQIELDSTDPEILAIYKERALQTAEQVFFKDARFGPYKDRDLISWLAENTARKKESLLR